MFQSNMSQELKAEELNYEELKSKYNKLIESINFI